MFDERYSVTATIETTDNPSPKTKLNKALLMSQYAIAFDLDTVAMDNDGLTDKTKIYAEAKMAFADCGFTGHSVSCLCALCREIVVFIGPAR